MAYDGPQTAKDWKAEYLKSLKMLHDLGGDLTRARSLLVRTREFLRHSGSTTAMQLKADIDHELAKKPSME